jgi:hypothetical protein
MCIEKRGENNLRNLKNLPPMAAGMFARVKSAHVIVLALRTNVTVRFPSGKEAMTEERQGRVR